METYFKRTEDELNRIINHKCLRRPKDYSNKYVDKYLASYRTLLSLLDDKDYANASKKAKMLKLDILIMRDNCLIIIPQKDCDIHIMTVIDFNARWSNLIIESPHIGTDNTGEATEVFFKFSGAKYCIINTVHPHCGTKDKSGKYDSDPAHCVDTFFYKIHCYLSNIRDSLFVQLHGMKSFPNFTMLIVNIFNSQFRKDGSGARIFSSNLVNFFDKDDCHKFGIGSELTGKAFGLPLTDSDGGKHNGVFRRAVKCHNTTVEGRQLNKNKDSGRFIHIEMGGRFRNFKNCKQLSLCLNDSMPEYNKQRGVKIIDEPDEDPEEIDFVDEDSDQTPIEEREEEKKEDTTIKHEAVVKNDKIDRIDQPVKKRVYKKKN